MVNEPDNTASEASLRKARKAFVSSLDKAPDAYVATELDGKPSDKQLMEIRTYIRANTRRRLDALVSWLYNRTTKRWELSVINAVPSII